MREDILDHLERIAAMKSDLDRDKETMQRAAKEIKRLRAELGMGTARAVMKKRRTALHALGND
jgi:hypothetical protein